MPRGRLLRALIVAAALLLIVVVVTQVVLWTNVPRDLVLSQLQRQLGLRVQAASLSTGWLGNTRLRDVTIALPLSDDSVVTVPAMRVKHNSLFGLVWSRAVTIDLVELNGPHLVVRQDEAGRWNVQEVADLLARAGGKQTAADQAKTRGRPKLPAIRVTDAVVEIIDRAGRRGEVRPVNVTGDPEGALTWRYDVSAGDVGTPPATETPALQLTGRLATGGTWEHEVDVHARQVQAWARPFAGDHLPAVTFAGEWNGQLREGGVAGRLVVAGLDVGGTHLTGAVRVGTEGGVVALRPEDLLVRTAHKVVPEVRVTAGRVAVGGGAATAEGLTVLTYGGASRVDGRYDWASGSGDLKADWSDFAVPGRKVTHGGTLTASLRQPLPGHPVVAARLASTGRMPADAAWQADLSLGGKGSDWSNMDWDFRATRLSLSGPRPVKLDGLAATVETRGELVSLTGLTGPGGVLARGDGRYNLSSRDWNFRLDLSNLPRPAAFGAAGPLALTFNARGSDDVIIFDNPGLSFRGTEAEVRAEGSYVFDVPQPVDVVIYVNHIPPRAQSSSTDQPPVFGYLRGQAKLLGTAMRPTNLTIDGHLVGRDVRFLDRSIGDLEADVTGRVDDERLTLKTEQLQVLGGRWQLDALFPERGVLGMNLSVNDLSLKEVAAVLKRPGLEGTVDARWAFHVPRLQAEAVKVTGDVKARGLKYGALAADSLEATVLCADGELHVDPVRLRKGDGQADLAAVLDVREFRRVTASLALAAWPFEPSPGTKAELWGGTTGLRVSLPGATREEGIRRGVFQPEQTATKVYVRGPIDLRAAFTLKDQPCGDLQLLADLRGRTVDLRNLTFDGLDGTVQGQALVNVDRPLEARGSVFFEDFNAERLVDFFPGNETLVGLGGRFSGRARLGPAPGPRALEPLRIQAEVASDKGHYRTISIGSMRASAFTNLNRIVVQDSPENPTTLELAGGLVRVWGRLSLLDPGQELNPATTTQPLLLSQMQVSFGRLDLDQIVHAFSPDADPMPGKLSGSFETLAGTRPRRRAGEMASGQSLLEKVVRRFTVDGRVEVTEAELGNLDVVAFFYNALNTLGGGGGGGNGQQAAGRGDLTFHIEDGLMSLNDVRYFNRGTELRGLFDIDELWRMPASPITGTAVGTARPFRDIRLPFLSAYDLDSILTVLQTDLTSVRVEGSVTDPKLAPLAFTDLGQGMRMFILGDVAREKRGARGR